MRQSPTKVTFNYPHTQIQPNLYSPRLIQSGFVLGQPIALTSQGQLPPNYQSFSPKINRPRAFTPNIYQSRYQNYQAPEPSQFAPPPHRVSLPVHTVQAHQTISRQQYTQLLDKYNSLQKRYRELQVRYGQLEKRGQIGFKNYSQVDIVGLIDKYKANLLHQSKLLMDRARLQSKEAQISRRIS